MSEFADVNLSLVDGVWIKQMHFQQAGWIAVTHAHTFDHQTLLTSGRLRVTVDGTTTEHTAPTILVIAKGTHHCLEALEDHTVAYCIHHLHDDVPVVEGIPNDQLHSLA